MRTTQMLKLLWRNFFWKVMLIGKRELWKLKIKLEYVFWQRNKNMRTGRKWMEKNLLSFKKTCMRVAEPFSSATPRAAQYTFCFVSDKGVEIKKSRWVILIFRSIVGLNYQNIILYFNLLDMFTVRFVIAVSVVPEFGTETTLPS